MEAVFSWIYVMAAIISTFPMFQAVAEDECFRRVRSDGGLVALAIISVLICAAVWPLTMIVYHTVFFCCAQGKTCCGFSSRKPSGNGNSREPPRTAGDVDVEQGGGGVSDFQGYDFQGYDFQGYDNQGYDFQGYDNQGYDNLDNMELPPYPGALKSST